MTGFDALDALGGWFNLQTLAWGAGGFVLVFWMVGAYNRLMALRNDIGTGWAQIEAVLQRRGESIEGLVPLLREPLAGEQGALETVLEAQRQVSAAAETLRRRPASARFVKALSAALAPWSSSVARLLSLLEQQPQAQQAPQVAPLLQALREAEARLPFARQGFNDAVAAYNEAVRQWPTRLLAKLFSFDLAAPL